MACTTLLLVPLPLQRVWSSGGWLTHRVCEVQKPQKLRHLLSEYGELGRVYLAPEGVEPTPAVCAHRTSGTRSETKNMNTANQH